MKENIEPQRVRAQQARDEIWSLLLSKEVWVALLGVAIAVAKWQGWNIPMDVFATIEVLIVAVIVVLAKT